MKDKYCLRRDNECHWYLIPVRYKFHFKEIIDKSFEELSEEDYRFLEDTRINSYTEIEFYLE